MSADFSRTDETIDPPSIYPAGQNILLTAADLGSGSCLTIGLTMVHTDPARGLLGLPDHALPLAAVYVGRSARPLGPPRRRRPTNEVTYRDHFDVPWRRAPEEASGR